jgi:hypothetical protein
MKQLLPIFTFAVLIACTNNTKNQANTEQQDSTSTAQVVEEPVLEEEVAEPDCVFNNDKYGLTTEWAKESGFTNFIWDAGEKQLKIPVNNDTIVLSKGGCNHFEYYAEYRLYADTATVGNVEHWKKIAIELANKFQFEQFSRTLNSTDFVYVNESTNAFWLEIMDEDPTDNLIYNGVEVDLSGEFKYVVLSQYVN